MDLSLLSGDQVHAVAAHLVVAEAIIHTRLPADTVRETRRYRVRIGDTLAQVASRRTGEWQISDATRPLASDTDVLVLVDFVPETVEYFLVPGDWFRDDVTRRLETYLRRVGERPQNPASRHHAVRTRDVAEWRSRWQVLL